MMDTIFHSMYSSWTINFWISIETHNQWWQLIINNTVANLKSRTIKLIQFSLAFGILTSKDNFKLIVNWKAINQLTEIHNELIQGYWFLLVISGDIKIWMNRKFVYFNIIFQQGVLTSNIVGRMIWCRYRRMIHPISKGNPFENWKQLQSWKVRSYILMA